MDRLKTGDSGRKGFCGESARLRVAYIGPHFGEEPPITGSNGSGTVFFTGCPLKCSFCQNYQISRDGLGRETDIQGLCEAVFTMIQRHSVHNINLVSPDHFFPHAFELVWRLRQHGHYLPVIYNLSGYQDPDMLRIANDFADIYLPDFKYADSALSRKLSRCRDYPRVALEAISEMAKQKGFLDFSQDEWSPARKGVLVRHLILPGQVQNSLDSLTMLFVEFGKNLPLSLMSQYSPVTPHDDPEMNRRLTGEEFESVYDHALDLGFEHLFVQFPAEEDQGNPLKASPLLPDFRLVEPFSKKFADIDTDRTR